MILRPPRSPRTYTLFPYPTLFRSLARLPLKPPATIEHKQRKDLALPIEPRVDIAYQGWRLSVLRERHRNGLKHLASAAVDNAERRRRIVMFGAVIVTLCSQFGQGQPAITDPEHTFESARHILEQRQWVWFSIVWYFVWRERPERDTARPHSILTEIGRAHV